MKSGSSSSAPEQNGHVLFLNPNSWREHQNRHNIFVSISLEFVSETRVRFPSPEIAKVRMPRKLPTPLRSALVSQAVASFIRTSEAKSELNKPIRGGRFWKTQVGRRNVAHELWLGTRDRSYLTIITSCFLFHGRGLVTNSC